MHQFCDAAGREYAITLTIGTFKKFRDALGIDMLTYTDHQLVELSTDIIRLIDMVFVAVADQALAHGLTSEDFGRALGGDEAQSAVMAFFRAYADFCPRAKRDALHKYLNMAQRVTEQREAMLTSIACGNTSIESQA